MVMVQLVLLMATTAFVDVVSLNSYSSLFDLARLVLLVPDLLMMVQDQLVLLMMAPALAALDRQVQTQKWVVVCMVEVMARVVMAVLLVSLHIHNHYHYRYYCMYLLFVVAPLADYHYHHDLLRVDSSR